MKNALEDVVSEIYTQLRIREAIYCACPQCQDDVVTHSLNNARPRYTTGSSIGGSVTRVSLSHEQARAELTVLVYDAMRLVAAHPRHGPEGFVPFGGGPM